MKIFVAVLLAFLAVSVFGLEPQKIAEVTRSAESPLDFMARLPASREFRLFYMLAGSGVIGALGSWLWKWSQGAADAHHFTLRYAVGQLLWICGSAIGAITTISFYTESGEFFGWWSVIYAGALAGFGGEIKNDRPQWDNAKRIAAALGTKPGDETLPPAPSKNQ